MNKAQNPPAQQPAKNAAPADQKAFKFCWFNPVTGPFIEATGPQPKIDLTPYVFPMADKVNPIGDAQYDVPKARK